MVVNRPKKIVQIIFKNLCNVILFQNHTNIAKCFMVFVTIVLNKIVKESLNEFLKNCDIQ